MELGFEFWYTAALLIVMTVLLVTERFEIEVVMFSVLLLLVLGDVITLQDAFSGFSNVGMLTIAMLFVIAGALNNTGVLRKVSDVIFGEKNNGVGRKLIRILFPVSAISAFMNNTPVVAMLIPIIRSWTERQQQFPSKYLIPISYAAILGGTCTLIGTSTNLIVHGLMLQHGLQGIGLFEITKIGVPATIVGLLFIVLIGHRLLPSRREPLVELGESTREFVIELKVTNDYENINKTIEASGLRHLKGLYLFQIERNGDTIAPARPDEKILEGDRLFFTGIPKTILELQKTPGLHLTKDSHFDLKDYDSSQIKTFECVVSDASPLVGKNIRESNFREKYQAVILAIHRHGQRIRKKIGDISINPGDTLLLLADKNFLRRWYHSKDFYLISKGENLPSKPQWQGNFSVAALIIIILLTVFNILPLLAAAGLGVLALVLSKIVSRSEILSIIDWRVLVIISLSLGIATGVEKS
ncbi:SLC13 family permease, partial [Candidatus Saccharibacteria bacterium]|nr:SLC13 family permease [Calditrichia bacterium]NIV97860.1 SLC13 family permease [Candidatus Saccharibacteria bacterium]NIW78146.1 SLC13 family permease [Calditrichia bacterium]